MKTSLEENAKVVITKFNDEITRINTRINDYKKIIDKADKAP